MKNNRTLINLFFFNGIFVFAISLIGPLYAIFVQQMTDDIVWVSVLWAAALFSSSVVVLYLSKRGDSFKDKNLLLTGYLIRAVTWFLFIFVNNIPFLIVLQIAIGVGEGMGTPAFNAIFAGHLDNGKHIAEYSDWTFINNVVIGLATIMGGVFVSVFGFKALFLVISFMSLIAAVGVYSRKTPYDLEGYGKKLIDGFVSINNRR